MQNRIKKMMSVIAFSLCAIYSYGQCDAEIKKFYAYMQNAEMNNDEANAGLLKAHMSAELMATLRTYAQQYDADAVIHAQDVCAYGIQSLTVAPMKDDWYLVKYKWSRDSEYTSIPVKAICTDGKLTILDIAPIGAEDE